MSELAAEHEALIQFLYMAPVGLAQTTLDGDIVMANPIAAQLLMPLARDGCLDNLFTVLADVAPDLRHRVETFSASHGTVCDAMRIRLPAAQRGARGARVLSLTLLKSDATRLMAVLSDITEQLERERLLRENEAWLNAVLSGISDYALARLDASGRVAAWNPSIGRLTGFAAPAVQGRPYSVFDPADSTTADRVLDRLRDASANGWSLDEGWRARADGSTFWGSSLIVPLQEHSTGDAVAGDGAETPAYCLVVRDISDKRDATEAQRRAICCDHLTGIANRRAFFEAAEVVIQRWRRAPRGLALVLLDADHFKSINDRHGHVVGDEVLREIAGILAQCVRATDTAARYAGDEFMLVLADADLKGARDIADRIRDRVARHEFAQAPGVRCTVSLGAAQAHWGIGAVEEWMQQADAALYQAKSTGRDRVVGATTFTEERPARTHLMRGAA